MFKGLCMTVCAAISVALPAHAQSSRITEDMAGFQFSLNGQTVMVDRSGAACPPNCVQPMLAAPGVGTIGELELFDFLDLFVSSGQGLLIDARLPERFSSGTLPGAVNVPTETLGPDNPYRDDLLNALGVRGGDFSNAYDLVIFGAGPDDSLAAEAVRFLVDSGYPVTKLKYYRGGLMTWRALGLTLMSGAK